MLLRGNQNASLFVVSVLALFLELLLIRWLGTEVNIFAYLQNTILISCFLGLGLGCCSCRQKINLYLLCVPLTIICLSLSFSGSREVLADISIMLSLLGDFVVWNMGTIDGKMLQLLSAGAGLALSFVLLLLVTAIFIPLGRILGRLFEDHPHTIVAYSFNIAGSLFGIMGFVFLSSLQTSPAVWLLIVALMTTVFLPKENTHRIIQGSLLTICVLSVWVSQRTDPVLKTIWSPYQKLSLVHCTKDIKPCGERSKYAVYVNNTGYQWIVDYSDADPEQVRRLPIPYNIPYLLHPSARKVLIVGTGTGNDVSAALRYQVEHVTAVEIDSAIVELGKEYHPEHPYQSKGVSVVVDDARSYFTGTEERYDLVVFGLLDSHTTTAMTNARLDHYVYTTESLRRAKELLAPGGMVVLTFQAQRFFIARRIFYALEEVFGHAPLVVRTSAGGQVLYAIGEDDVVETSLANNTELRSSIQKLQERFPLTLSPPIEVTTDDWPYLYLEKRGIPSLFYCLGVLFVILFWFATKFSGVPVGISSWKASDWHFFFLGAAFLLLEVQNVSKISVVFGSTWSTNAVVISGILSMILLANWTAARFPKIPLALVYAGLLASCVLLYFTDLAQFGFLPLTQKVLIVSTLTALPIFFSGIIFIRSFAAISRKDLALGANLLGSIVGGYLQSITFLTGVRALLLIVAIFYLLSFLLYRPDNAKQ